MIRLDNWAFARDMSRACPTVMEAVLFKILKVDMLYGEITTDYFKGVMKQCSYATTQDGFEAALVVYCQKLSENLVGDKFEEFLSRLDYQLDILIEKLGREHDVTILEKY